MRAKIFNGLIVLGVLLPTILSARGQFGNGEQEAIVCGAKNAENRFKTKDYSKYVEGIFEAASAGSPTSAQAVALEEFRMAQIAKMRVSADADGQKPYYKEVGPDGKINHFFYLANTLLSRWDDTTPEGQKFIRQVVEQECQSNFPEIAQYCIDSFYKRKENVGAFLKKHAERIKYYGAHPPEPGKTWEEIMRNDQFERDDITDNNLRFNASPYMSQIEILKLGGVQVVNRDRPDEIVGYMVPIEVDGKQEWFFAELRGDQVLWPYYFIFGGPKASEWNKIFEKKYGEFKVGDLPMNQYLELANRSK